MARIWREWKHPRDTNGRFAEKGSAKWAERAFKAAEAAGVKGDKTLSASAFSMHQGGGSGPGRMEAFSMTFGGGAKKAAPSAPAGRHKVREMSVKGKPMHYVVDTKTGQDVGRFRDKGSADAMAQRLDKQRAVEVQQADAAVAKAATVRTPQKIEERYRRAADRVARLDGDNLNDRESRAAHDELAKARAEREAAIAAGVIKAPASKPGRGRIPLSTKQSVNARENAAAALAPRPHLPTKEDRRQENLMHGAGTAMREDLAKVKPLAASGKVTPRAGGRDPMQLAVGDHILYSGGQRSGAGARLEVIGKPETVDEFGQSKTRVRVRSEDGEEGFVSFGRSDRARVLPRSSVDTPRDNGQAGGMSTTTPAVPGAPVAPEAPKAATTRGRIGADAKRAVAAREGRTVTGVDMTDPNRWSGEKKYRFEESARMEANGFAGTSTLDEQQRKEMRAAVDEFGRTPVWETARLDAAARKIQVFRDEDAARKADFTASRKRLAEAVQARGRADAEQFAKDEAKAVKKANGIPGDAAIKQLPDGQRHLAESIIFDARNVGRTTAAAKNNKVSGEVLREELARTDLSPHTRTQVQKLHDSLQHMATDEGVARMSAELQHKIDVWNAVKQAKAEGVTGDAKGGYDFEVMPGGKLTRGHADELTLLGRQDGHALANRAAEILRGEEPKKPALQQVSDAVAEQRGLVKEGPVSMAPGKLSEEDFASRYGGAAAAISARRAATPTGDNSRAGLAQARAAERPSSMESIKEINAFAAGGRTPTPYDNMGRAELVSLSTAAGLPVRGRNNTRLADALHAADQKKKATRAKALNPSGVGEPSSQHEKHTGDGGMARQAALNEGVTALRAKMAEQKAEPRRHQTFAERMAGDMSESDRLAAHARSDELRAQARAQEAERARQVAEAEANDTRSEREKLTEQLRQQRAVQDINMRNGRVDPARAARIKAAEARLEELDIEDRKAKLKALDAQKGDKVRNKVGEFEVVGKTADGYLRVLRPDGRKGLVDPNHVEAVTKAPKAEAAQVAAPVRWIDKATGREVTNPGQVGIVRGDIVKADSEAGKAALAAREARGAEFKARNGVGAATPATSAPTEREAKIAAKEAELEQARQRLQAAGEYQAGGSSKRKQFAVRMDGALRRAGQARNDIVRLENELKALRNPKPEAPKAGPVNFDDIKPGGIIKRDGQYYRVVKVNPKSVKVEMPPGWDDVFKKDAKITEVHAPGIKVTKAGAVPEAPKASTTRGRFDRTLKARQLDTRRDNSQTGGVSKTPATTGANMSKAQEYTRGEIRSGVAGAALERFERNGEGSVDLDTLKSVRDNERAPEGMRRAARAEIARRGEAANKGVAQAPRFTGEHPTSWDQVKPGDVVTIHDSRFQVTAVKESGLTYDTPGNSEAYRQRMREHRIVEGFYINKDGTPGKRGNGSIVEGAPGGRGAKPYVHLDGISPDALPVRRPTRPMGPEAAARPRTGTWKGDIPKTAAGKTDLRDKAFSNHITSLTLAVNTSDQAKAFGFESQPDRPAQVGDEVMVNTFGMLRRGVVTHTTRDGLGTTRVAYATPSGGYAQETSTMGSRVLHLVNESDRPREDRSALLPKVTPEARAPRMTEEQKAAAKEAKKVEERADRARRRQAFFDEKINGIEKSLKGEIGNAPEWHLQMTTEEGLVALAKHLGVKVANRKSYTSGYISGTRPRSRDDLDKIRQDIIAKIRGDLGKA